jgi:hypothetical protein
MNETIDTNISSATTKMIGNREIGMGCGFDTWVTQHNHK